MQNGRKEKRYELIKGDGIGMRNPHGMNALGDPESSVNGDILENRSKYETAAPRSSLNNNMYNRMMNARAPRPKPDGNPQGSAPGTPQAQTKRQKKR